MQRSGAVQAIARFALRRTGIRKGLQHHGRSGAGGIDFDILAAGLRQDLRRLRKGRKIVRRQDLARGLIEQQRVVMPAKRPPSSASRRSATAVTSAAS
jgi:hypothetical protein